MVDSLWGEEFTIKETPKETKKIINKIKQPKEVKFVDEAKAVKSKKLSIDEKLKIITDKVNQTLGVYKENTVVIKTKQQLVEYIDKAIENKELAVDTETNNSLDPVTCKLMGPCFYTPGMKNAYVPINHVNKDTNERFDWQLTEADIKEQLARLTDVKLIFHNGKFDYEVIKCTCDIQLKIFWDTMIGAKILNENERSAGLKQQYIDKIDPNIEKYSIDALFEDIEYAVVDPDIFALYAATDAYMTYRLYQWQKEQFEKPGNEKLYKMFLDIEVPVTEVIAEMELAGVEVDQEYAKLLSAKYHKQLDSVDAQINKELETLKPKIDSWRLTPDANYKPPKKSGEGEGKSKSEQLTYPINLGSPTQLAILFYDILKAPIVDKKQPRATGEDALKAIADHLNLDICSLLLKRRELVKLLSTYIDVIPELAKRWPDGRVRTHFNSLGAATGRLSSSDPINLQNIPSHNKEIRMLFKPSDGNVFVGSDFSQQEPRLLANYAQDENMINAYKNKQDLYATVASKVYNNGYWDNMEHYEDGTPNPDGKKRRGFMKSVVLGIMYGRGAASVAEQIGQSVEAAQDIINKFYEGFPKVKKWIDETTVNAHKTGYVEELWGRRRRLPDLLLDKYEVKLKNNDSVSEFNPLLNCKQIIKPQSSMLVDKYKEALSKCKSRREYEALKLTADKEGVLINNNTGFIAQAERQCVNARVQGGAASMSKRAMILIHQDKLINDLGFKLEIAVHDELIGECPKENADKVAERLSYLMIESGKPECVVPMKCDAVIESCWYITDFFDLVQSEFTKLVASGKSKEEAFNEMCEIRTESTIPQLHEILDPLMNN